MDVSFGSLLKEWRQIRRMSQLDLASAAGVSARHVSFLETGRSYPSRGMALRLSDVLQMPLAESNRLLTSGGLAPAFGQRAASDEELAPLAMAMQWTLDHHAPYPAMALDRHWRLVALNAPASMFLAPMGVQVGDSLIEALLENDSIRAAIENLSEVEYQLLSRLRVELAHLGKDQVLSGLIERLADRVTGYVPPAQSPVVMATRYTFNGVTLSLFSTISQFGGVGEIAYADIKIEQLFPADEASRQLLLAMAGPEI